MSQKRRIDLMYDYPVESTPKDFWHIFNMDIDKQIDTKRSQIMYRYLRLALVKEIGLELQEVLQRHFESPKYLTNTPEARMVIAGNKLTEAMSKCDHDILCDIVKTALPGTNGHTVERIYPKYLEDIRKKEIAKFWQSYCDNRDQFELREIEAKKLANLIEPGKFPEVELPDDHKIIDDPKVEAIGEALKKSKFIDDTLTQPKLKLG